MDEELHARLTRATLEIRVKKDSPLLIAEAELSAKLDAVAAAVEALPTVARPEYSLAPGRLGSDIILPEYDAFIDRLDWPAIRAEFARKAKKIGGSARHDVSISDDNGFVRLTCEVRDA